MANHGPYRPAEFIIFSLFCIWQIVCQSMTTMKFGKKLAKHGPYCPAEFSIFSLFCIWQNCLAVAGTFGRRGLIRSLAQGTHLDAPKPVIKMKSRNKRIQVSPGLELDSTPLAIHVATSQLLVPWTWYIGQTGHMLVVLQPSSLHF
jgi:hypothetical protein